MQAYDIFMLVVLIAATIFGAWKGMAWQIASLASLTLSYLVALTFSPQLAPVFGDEAPWNRFLAMFVLYAATSLVIWMIFRLVGGVIDRLKLREFDRQIGALFGLAKGILLCVAITLFAVCLLPKPQKESIISSRSGYYIALLLDQAHGVMPEELHVVLHPYIHRGQELLHGDLGADESEGFELPGDWSTTTEDVPPFPAQLADPSRFLPTGD